MMTLPLRSIFAALLFAGILSPALANEPQAGPPVSARLDAAASEAAAVVDAFHTALRSGDLTAAAALLDDEALVFEAGGVERSKAEYAAHHLSADAAFSEAVPSVVTARAGGSANGFAWLATESRMTGSFKGSVVDRVSTETMLLRHADGAWKIVHIHWSSARAKKP